MKTEFWNQVDKIISSSEIVIDRPKGSCHPKYTEAIYPIDYGYLQTQQGAMAPKLIFGKTRW
jgi:hypothetical protein